MSVSHFERVAAPVARRRRPAGDRRRSLARLLAWWQSPRLDRELAAGVAPAASIVLAVRAERLTHRRSRRRIANGLAGALRQATDATPRLSAAIPPHGREVLAARVVLAALDRRLRAPEPVTARGMAMLRTLLTDGTSALYQPDVNGALGSRLRAAAAALEPDQRS